MKKEVKIIDTANGKIIAGCDKTACEGCKSSLFCRGKNSEFEVFNPENIEIKDGDEVIIDLPSGRTILASAMSLIFPLICFFAGMLVTYFIIPGNELAQLAGGIILLAVGFGISALYFRFAKKKFTPSIREKAE